MTKLAFQILKLFWPFIKEIFLTQHDDPRKNRNRDFNLMFTMACILFVTSLYLMAYGLENHRFYTTKISDTAVLLERSKHIGELAEALKEENQNLRQVNQKNREEIALINRLLTRALDGLPLASAEELLRREIAYTLDLEQKEKIRKRLQELNSRYNGNR